MTTEQATTESVTAQLTRRGLIKPPAIVPEPQTWLMLATPSTTYT